MKYSARKAEDFILSKWSGGSTTQLFIYPTKANYAARDFDFRISTATVEVEKSAFTALPGFSRKLMILDGEIEITHKHRFSKTVKKFEVESFEGDWETSSIGLCTDFNVMTNSHFKSELYPQVIYNGQHQKVRTLEDSNFLFIYLWQGKLLIQIDDDHFSISERDLLVIQKPKDTKINIIATKDSQIICTEIVAAKQHRL
jgi:environmental stress-induced protein Ves